MEGWACGPSDRVGMPGTPSFNLTSSLYFVQYFTSFNLVSDSKLAKLHAARNGRHCFGGFLLVLSLRLHFLIFLFLFGVADFDSTLDIGAFFDADAVCDHVAGEHAFAANIQAIGAYDIPLHLAHDHNFIGGNIRRNDSIAPDGDTIAGKVDRSFNAPVNEERFRACNLAFDDERASDSSLIHGCSGRLDRGVTVCG